MATNGDFMTLSALTRLTKTSKGFIALSLLALVTACGGGGGGGGSDAGVVEKIAIDYPNNNAQVVDASRNLQLRYLTSDRDYSKVAVILNGTNISGFFKQTNGVGPYVSLYALQGIINEGSNNLTVRMTGSSTAKSDFKADIQKPELMITDAGPAGPDSNVYNFDGFIRKNQIENITYETPASGQAQSIDLSTATGTDGKSFTGAQVLLDTVQTDDTKADITFVTTDKTTALSGGAGNTSTLNLALPGREIQAALAAQINNSAFDAVEDLVASLVPALLNKAVSDQETPFFDYQEAKDNAICSQVTNILNNAVVFPADSDGKYNCQVFINQVQVVQQGSLGAIDGVVNPDITIASPAGGNAGVDFVASAETATNSELLITVEVAVYDKDKTVKEVAITLPMVVQSTTRNSQPVQGFEFELLGALTEDAGDLRLTLPPLGKDISNNDVSNAVAITLGFFDGGGDGECVDTNSNTGEACQSQSLGGAAVNTIVGEIESELDTSTLAVSINKALTVALFCNKDNGGTDPEVCDGPEVAAAEVENTGTLLEKGADLRTLELENGTKLGSALATRSVKKVQVVDAASKGAFVQLAASTTTQNKVPELDAQGNLVFDANDQVVYESGFTNAKFKDILGTVFKPLSQNSVLSSATPDLGSDASSDVLIALPVNVVNQALAGVFQSGVVEYQSAEVELSEFAGAGQLYNQNSLPTFPGFDSNCIGLPSTINGSDKLVFDEGSLKLKTAPYLEFVTENGLSYAELHLNGLTATARLTDKTDNPKIAEAADIELDVVARLQLGVNAKRKPEIAIDASSINLYAAKVHTFIDDAITTSQRDCLALAKPAVKKELEKQQITANDLYAALPTLLGPVLDGLNTELIKENTQTINLQGLGIEKQVDVVLNTDGFNVKGGGEYFLLSADICERAAGSVPNKCEAGTEAVYSLKVIDQATP